MGPVEYPNIQTCADLGFLGAGECINPTPPPPPIFIFKQRPLRGSLNFSLIQIACRVMYFIGGHLPFTVSTFVNIPDRKGLFTHSVTITVSKSSSKFNIASMVTDILMDKMGYTPTLSVQKSVCQKDQRWHSQKP